MDEKASWGFKKQVILDQTPGLSATNLMLLQFGHLLLSCSTWMTQLLQPTKSQLFCFRDQLQLSLGQGRWAWFC